jgi:hypothetical protein
MMLLKGKLSGTEQPIYHNCESLWKRNDKENFHITSVLELQEVKPK